MSLDHGVLNVPLSKRGNIDAQLEAFKAKQAQAARAKAKAEAMETKSLRSQAKAAVEAIPDDKLARIAAMAGRTPTQVRKQLLSDAHWRPAWLLRVLGVPA